MDQIIKQEPARPDAPSLTADALFPGDGEMARLMRALDWSRTPLGSVET